MRFIEAPPTTLLRAMARLPLNYRLAAPDALRLKRYRYPA
jgi:hypothetical protein